MLKQLKLAALGLIAASAILPVASPANAALSKDVQESVSRVQAEVPQEKLLARRRYRLVRRVCTRYRRYRVRVRVRTRYGYRYSYRYRNVCIRYRNYYR
ncbi:MAG: hypothetical protein AAF208_13790 [Cyanobacteria bacterium P01_A01_bin.45]